MLCCIRPKKTFKLFPGKPSKQFVGSIEDTAAKALEYLTLQSLAFFSFRFEHVNNFDFSPFFCPLFFFCTILVWCSNTFAAWSQHLIPEGHETCVSSSFVLVNYQVPFDPSKTSISDYQQVDFFTLAVKFKKLPRRT